MSRVPPNFLQPNATKSTQTDAHRGARMPPLWQSFQVEAFFNRTHTRSWWSVSSMTSMYLTWKLFRKILFPINYEDVRILDTFSCFNPFSLHLGVRPYKCEHCESDFTDNRALKKHCLAAHGVETKGGIRKDLGLEIVKTANRRKVIIWCLSQTT